MVEWTDLPEGVLEDMKRYIAIVPFGGGVRYRKQIRTALFI